MQPRISVRPATTDDVPDINLIAAETWHATYRGHIPQCDIEEFLRANYNPEHLRAVIEANSSGVLVASVEDDPAGYATVSRDGDGNAQLWSIYVLPRFQRQGIGQALWDAAVEHARSLGLPKLVLWVLEETRAARKFYEGRGATVSGQRDFRVGGGRVNEVRYELRID